MYGAHPGNACASCWGSCLGNLLGLLWGPRAWWRAPEPQWAIAAAVRAARGAWGSGAARTAMGHRRRLGAWSAPRGLAGGMGLGRTDIYIEIIIHIGYSVNVTGYRMLYIVVQIDLEPWPGPHKPTKITVCPHLSINSTVSLLYGK